MFRFVSLVALLLLTVSAHGQRVGVGSYGRAPGAGEQPPDLSNIGLDQKLGDTVPLSLEFLDEYGKETALAPLVGDKPTILVLAYFRCPKLCNQVMNGLLDTLREIKDRNVGEHFNVLVVSIDPKDTFNAAWIKQHHYLKDYGRPNAEKGWHFLTGRQEEIDELAKVVGFRYEVDKTKKPVEYQHPSGIMVITPYGKLSKYFFGIAYDPEELKSALDSAAGNKIGNAVEPSAIAQLLCFDYDPQTRKYTASVMKILRLAGILVVLVIGVWLLCYWHGYNYHPETGEATLSSKKVAFIIASAIVLLTVATWLILDRFYRSGPAS